MGISPERRHAEWTLDSDLDLTVSVQTASTNYDAHNVITVRDDDSGGVVRVYLHSVDELIDALAAARDRLFQEGL